MYVTKKCRNGMIVYFPILLYGMNPISREFLDGINHYVMHSKMVFLGLGTSSVLAAYF